MKYRTLGNTGLKISEIGLGGQWLRSVSLETCKEVFDICAKNGVNILDCWMPEPDIRSNFGECIKGNRDHWIIQGHIGSTWQEEQYVKTRDMDQVKPAFEDFMERLGIDSVDLGMIHYVDTEEDWEEIINGPFIEYVHELKRTGKIKHVGLSSHNPVTAKKAILSGEVEMIMFAVNPAFDMVPSDISYNDIREMEQFDESFVGTDPDRAELYRLCEERNIGITVMKAFAGGRLFDPELSPFNKAMTPVQCIHYALTRPGTVSVLAGYLTPNQALESISYETASPEEKDYSEIMADASHYMDTRKCLYCNHCKPCPKDIDIASVNKYCDLATMHDEVPDTVRSHYGELKANASDCIECGGCETRCPFHVPVIQLMRKAKNVFG